MTVDEPNYYDALPNARRAVWNAIDTHEDTRELFNLKLKFGDATNTLGQLVPGFADLDAIWIAPAGADEKTLVTTQQSINYALRITVWSKDHNYDRAERILFKLKRAICSARPPDGGPRYLARYAPLMNPANSTITLTTLGDENPINVTKTTTVLNLKVPFIPDP